MKKNKTINTFDLVAFLSGYPIISQNYDAFADDEEQYYKIEKYILLFFPDIEDKDTLKETYPEIVEFTNWIEKIFERGFRIGMISASRECAELRKIGREKFELSDKTTVRRLKEI